MSHVVHVTVQMATVGMTVHVSELHEVQNTCVNHPRVIFPLLHILGIPLLSLQLWIFSSCLCAPV